MIINTNFLRIQTNYFVYRYFIGLSLIHDKGINYDLFEIKFIVFEFYITFVYKK